MGLPRVGGAERRGEASPARRLSPWGPRGRRACGPFPGRAQLRPGRLRRGPACASQEGRPVRSGTQVRFEFQVNKPVRLDSHLAGGVWFTGDPRACILRAVSGGLDGSSRAAWPPAHSKAQPLQIEGRTRVHRPWEAGPPPNPARPRLAPHAPRVTALDGGSAYPGKRWLGRRGFAKRKLLGTELTHPRGPGSESFVLDSPLCTYSLGVFGNLKRTTQNTWVKNVDHCLFARLWREAPTSMHALKPWTPGTAENKKLLFSWDSLTF